MLDDPRVNFAISRRGGTPGVQHRDPGGDPDELTEVLRLAGRRAPVIEQGETTCCYAHSEKSWIDDPRASSGRHS